LFLDLHNVEFLPHGSEEGLVLPAYVQTYAHLPCIFSLQPESVNDISLAILIKMLGSYELLQFKDADRAP
jgi:hypothetical protein